jgi:uncharacterized phiE125 gp8 family phage protein
MAWLPPVVTVGPATEPVSLAEAETQCRVSGADHTADLTRLVKAARSQVEKYCGIKLVSQTVLLRCSDFCDLINLPVAPIISVSSITYLDPAGAEQTLSTDVYESVLTDLEPHIRLKINQSWPSIRCASDAIRVTVVAGYAALEEDIKHALLLQIGNWFDSRAEGELSEGAKSLLSNYRRF